MNVTTSSIRIVPKNIAWASTLGLIGSLAAQTAAPVPASTDKTKKEGQPNEDLPEVVVTAQSEKVYKPERLQSPKYSQPLRDVPQTVTVIPKQMIQDQGAQTLSEVMRNIPGVTMLAGEGGGAAGTAGDTFFMRGFDATNSIFVDGVRNNGAITRDVFNLEQVEVFKGPTGSDTGRATASGYVNLGTKVPTLTVAYSGSAAVGSGEASLQRRFTVDGNLPVRQNGQDVLGGTAFRLNGLYQDGGVPGRDVVERESYAIAPSLAFGLNEDVRVYLYSMHMRQDNIPDYGIPANAVMKDNALYNSNISRSNFYGSNRDEEDVEQDSYTARIEWDINDSFTLRNQTYYSRNHRFAIITSPGNSLANGTVNRSRNINERFNKIFTNQTNLTGEFNTGLLKHNLLAGFEYIWEEQYAPAWTGAGTMPPADATSPDPDDDIAGYHPRRNGNQYSIGETDTYALYLFDTISLGDKWQINGGVRWEYYQTSYYAQDVAGAPTADLSTSGDLLSWKLGVVYKPVPIGSIYLSYGLTKTPPGGANFALNTTNNNANNINAEPQESSNIELGTKWDLIQERLFLSAAIFRSENSNEITVDPTDPNNINRNSKRRVDGAEIGLTGQLSDNWSIYAGFAYLDASFAESANEANAGSTLQWTPKYSGSLWTTYRIHPKFTVGFGARYQGEIQRQNTNAPSVTSPENPAYWVLDAMAQYQVTDKFSLRLNLYNLTDELYATSLNNNGGRVNPGSPFSAMLTASYKF
ncbi:MAG TPA: TonB-dependent siderophore receptor [Prosthecobacter sp.]